MAMTPEDEALLAQIMFGGGVGQMQAPRPGLGSVYPQPDILPPGQMMPPRMMDWSGPSGLYPPNMDGVTVKGVKPKAAPAPMREPVNPPRPAPRPYGGPDLPPLARGSLPPPEAPQTAIATNDMPMPTGVSPAQPAGPEAAARGLFADKSEIMSRLEDMMMGWAAGAGGTWQDSLAMGGKFMQAGKLTRKQESDLAKSGNATKAWALQSGLVDEATADAYIQNKDARGLIDYVNQQREAQAKASQPVKPSDRFKSAGGGIFDTETQSFITPPGGEKGDVTKAVEERKAIAADLGIKPDDPRYTSYVSTGKFPREDAQELTATDKKFIAEADEMVNAAQGALPLIDRALELNKTAYEGPFAGTRGWAGSFVGADGAADTVELDNVVTEQALSQMKAIFGGNPTEGERAILLDIAGSSSMPAAVRQKVFERAKAAVQRRLEFYRNRADELRGGDYYKDGRAAGNAGTPAAPAATAGAAPARRRYNPATGELE